MERREQGTSDYRYAQKRQPVRNTSQTRRSGANAGQKAASHSIPAERQLRKEGMVATAGKTGTKASSVPIGKPRTAAQVRRDREAAARAVKASGKPDIRLFLIAAMGFLVLGAMGWGICQHIKGINTRGELTTYEEARSIKKIEDNTENAGKTIDVEKLIQKLLDNVVFDAELNKLDDSVAEGMIDIAEGSRMQFYAGNGIYADEIIVITATNEENAKKNQENVKLHLSETKKAFQNYIPEEAEKIDKAVSIRCGCYVIVCITSDYEKAEKLIQAMIQE